MHQFSTVIGTQRRSEQNGLINRPLRISVQSAERELRVAGVQRTAKSMVININLHKVHDDRKSAPRPYASGRK